MAERAKITIDIDGIKDIQTLRQNIRLLEDDYKSHIKTQGEVYTTLIKYRTELKQQVADTKVLSQVLPQLTQAQIRVANGWTSMSTSLNQLNATTVSLDKRMNTANQTLISFSQGMQDAGQFSMGLQQGMRGVANNIQQVSQMFALLYRETGSVGGAFGMMIKQLNSPAGLLVALAGVTTAIQIIPSLFKDAAKASKEALDQMTKDANLFSKYGFGFDVAQNMDLAKAVIKSQMQGMGEEFGISDDNGNIVGTRYVPRPENKSQFERLQKDLATIEEFEKVNKKVLDDERERSALHGLINKYTAGTLDTLEKIDADAKKKRKGKNAGLSSPYAEFTPYGSQSQADMASFMFGDAGQLGNAGMSPDQEPKSDVWRKPETAREYLDRQEKAWKDFYDRKEEMMKRDAEITEQNLRGASELYNSVFFSPLKAGFDAIANGSQNMAKAVGDAIKKMLIQLAEFAAAAGILSLLNFGGFMPIFGQLAGIGKLPTPVTNKPMTLNTGRTADLMSANTSGRVIQIVGETKLKDDYVLIQYKRANALKNSSRA